MLKLDKSSQTSPRLGLLTGLMPPPRLRVDQWADQYRVIAPPAPEPGRWRTDRAPYQRGILEALTAFEEVVVVSSSQVGKSETILNTLGYFLHLDPTSILLVQPTLEMAEDFSKTRVSGLLQATPVLGQLFGKLKSRASNSTLLFKQFAGGFLAIGGANSPAGLASRPIRILLLDEVDRYPATAGSEGDPVNLARKRTTNYWNRLILMVSTPTSPKTSRITREWERSDQRRYFVPCPHCNHYQYLVWSQIAWDPVDPQSAWYECSECRKPIQDWQKSGMLRRGEWRSTATAQSNKIAGFHIWEAYSPWRTFGDIVQSYLAAKSDPMLLQVWHNTCLGEAWEPDEGSRQDWESLQYRAEPYPLWEPTPQTLILTAGVDVQADRLVWTLVGWGKDYECWILGYEEIFGDPVTPRPWEILDSRLQQEYGGLTIQATCVDSGYRTDEVCAWVRPRQNRRIHAIKGSSQPGKPILGRPTLQDVNHNGQVIKRGIRLWPIGTDTAKGTIFARLGISEPGSHWIHIPQGLPDLPEYLKGLCSEKLVTRYIKGQPYQAWEKFYKRNEPLDTLIYALAAVQSLGRIRWGTLERKPIEPDSQPTDPPPQTETITRPKQRDPAGSGWSATDW